MKHTHASQAQTGLAAFNEPTTFTLLLLHVLRLLLIYVNFILHSYHEYHDVDLLLGSIQETRQFFLSTPPKL